MAHKVAPGGNPGEPVFNAIGAGLGTIKNLPFSIFKRADRRFYSVKFKNEDTGEYIPAISTKQETERAAIETAFQWLREGIPQGKETVPFKKYTLREMAKESDLTAVDAEFICQELRRRGLVKSFILSESKQAIDFSGYLKNFWNFDDSAYIKEKS